MILSTQALEDKASALADQATAAGAKAARTTQGLAQQALDGLQGDRSHASAALQQLADGASALTHRGVDAVRDSGQQLAHQSAQARHAAAEHIQHDPIKSVLIAAAVGAALMGLLAVFSRQRDSGR